MIQKTEHVFQLCPWPVFYRAETSIRNYGRLSSTHSAMYTGNNATRPAYWILADSKLFCAIFSSIRRRSCKRSGGWKERESLLAELSSRMDAGESTRGENQMVLVRFGRVQMDKASEREREKKSFPAFEDRHSLRSTHRLVINERGWSKRERSAQPSWPLQPLANFVGPLDGINHSHRGQVHQYDALCTPVTNLTRPRRTNGILDPRALSYTCVRVRRHVCERVYR